MKPNGQLFIRFISLLLLLTTLGYPGKSDIYAQSVILSADDFNRCSPDLTQWTFENPANISGASPTITGQYTGESLLKMTVPPGESYTFSGSNTNAPRVMQEITDNDFEIEVKFNAPINSDDGDWKIQGILVRDATNASQPKWFRFDFNSRNGGLNSYHGYIDATGDLTHIRNVFDLPGANPTSGPLFIRVKYVKSTGNWTVTHQVGASGAIISTVDFLESTYDANFVVTDIGLFVGSTGTNPPGHTMMVDYIKNVSQTSYADDAVQLNVTTSGTGVGSINWPMTSASQCNGTTVTLTASPDSGSSFSGWSGDATGSQPTIQVQMNTSKNLVANFESGEPIDLPYQTYIPILNND